RRRQVQRPPLPAHLPRRLRRRPPPDGRLRRQTDQTPRPSSARQALTHNAITDVLSAVGEWVPLSVRAAAARAALAEVDAWHAADPNAPAAAGVAPATDQTGLRDRIAEALLDHLSRTADIRPSRDGEMAFMPEVTDEERLRIADAVMAVADAEQAELRAEVGRLSDWYRTVSERVATAEADRDRWHDELVVNEADRVAAVQRAEASVDRAAVLREEAALIRAHCPDHLSSDSADGAWMVCHCPVAEDMERRLAAEAPQPEPAGAQQADTVAPDACTCAAAGDALVPAGHYADCPSPEARPA
ncbi:hypothetical protein, partial [Streptomyces sp. NPDC003832]